MDKLMTEMLKGTLEGMVMAVVAREATHGSDIATRLRDLGFSDIAEGTVYAVLIRIEQRGLVDVTKVPSPKGPPRKVYSINDEGRASLADFWTTWTVLAERLDHLREEGK